MRIYSRVKIHKITEPMSDYHARTALISGTYLMTDADYQCVDIHVWIYVCGAMVLDRANRNPSKRLQWLRM